VSAMDWNLHSTQATQQALSPSPHIRTLFSSHRQVTAPTHVCRPPSTPSRAGPALPQCPRAAGTESHRFVASNSWAQWCTPVITALERLRQEDLEFQASLSDIVRHCLKKPNQTKPNQKQVHPSQFWGHCLPTPRQVSWPLATPWSWGPVLDPSPRALHDVTQSSIMGRPGRRLSLGLTSPHFWSLFQPPGHRVMSLSEEQWSLCGPGRAKVWAPEQVPLEETWVTGQPGQRPAPAGQVLIMPFHPPQPRKGVHPPSVWKYKKARPILGVPHPSPSFSCVSHPKLPASWLLRSTKKLTACSIARKHV
jgi:hypothetical protein